MKACFPIDIFENSLCSVDPVKNLGVWFDSDYSLSKHVQNICKSCFVKLCDFRHVRWFLTHDVSVLGANALVSSRLDYRNSLFRKRSKFNLCKLQCIQNSAARIVSNTSQYTSITTVLKPHLFISIFTQVFPGILLHIFLPTAVVIVPGTVKLVVISFSFHRFTLLFIKLSNSLVIVLLLMLPLYGMFFLMRLVPLLPWLPSESSLKPTCTPTHTHLSLDHYPGILHGA